MLLYTVHNLSFLKLLAGIKNKVSKMVCGKYKPDTDEVAAIVSALHLTEQQYWNIFFLPNLSPNCDKSTSFNLNATLKITKKGSGVIKLKISKQKIEILQAARK